MDLRFGGFKNFKKINTIYVGFNEILIYGQHIIYIISIIYDRDTNKEYFLLENSSHFI